MYNSITVYSILRVTYYDADLKVFSFGIIIWVVRRACFFFFYTGRKGIIGDAKGERIEEHYNTKLNLFIYLRKRKSTPLSKLCLVVWLLTNTAYTFYQLGTVDRNFFLLCFLIWEMAIQMLMEEIRKTIKAPIKNLNSLAAYMV